MSHRCDISGISHQNGNRVSHANNKTHHMFFANLQSRRVFIPDLKKYVALKLSTRVIRTIDKIGIEATLRKYGKTSKDLTK